MQKRLAAAGDRNLPKLCVDGFACAAFYEQYAFAGSGQKPSLLQGGDKEKSALQSDHIPIIVGFRLLLSRRTDQNTGQIVQILSIDRFVLCDRVVKSGFDPVWTGSQDLIKVTVGKGTTLVAEKQICPSGYQQFV